MFFKEKIWINWKLEKTKDGKTTKIPYQTDGNKASSTDPETWSTYEKAKENIDKFSGIGIVLDPRFGVLGIDFDHCVEELELKNKKIEDFIKRANTYCEYSPSGTGVHLLFKCTGKLELERNKQIFNKETGEAIEVYNNGRYFTYTENEHELSKEVREISPEEFIDLLKTLGYPWKKKDKEKPTSEIKGGVDLTDEQILEKAFNSKTGGKFKKLYEGDTSEYNNDASSADFALCSSLAFWTGKDKERMRNLWLDSPLGQRDKTQKRKDYQDRTLENAIDSTNEVYSPHREIDYDEEFIMSKGSKNTDPVPLLILENICRVLETDELFKGKFRMNDFSHLVETCWNNTEWINLYDGCILDVVRLISQKYEPFRKVQKTMVTDAIFSVANNHKVNPPRDYFSSLVWDGKPRLNSWLHHAYGVPDDELHQAIGSNWLKGLVKRVMKPGCIFDEVLTLESKQGWRKSTSIRELGSPWHVETSESADNKDFYITLAQNVIVEFSEGEIFNRTSVQKLKAEITKTEDQFRPPYERGIIKFKRSCVFAVTTNQLDLKDDTGNRRWLPVQLEKPADVEWIKENRDQIFAEAYHRVIIVGETTHEYPKDSLEELQDSRTERTVEDEKILNWYATLSKEEREDGISIIDVSEVVHSTDSPDMLKQKQMAGALRRLGLEKRQKKIDGKNHMRWFPSEKTNKILSKIISNPIKDF